MKYRDKLSCGDVLETKGDLVTVFFMTFWSSFLFCLAVYYSLL